MVIQVVSRPALLVAALVLSAAPLTAGEPKPTCVVAYDADRLTVHAKGVPLGDVVREIGRKSGAEVVGDVRKPREVSQELDGVPLVDALARLLRDQNFTLRYGAEGKLQRIVLLGEPVPLAPVQTAQADASKPDGPAPRRRHHHHDVQPSRETLPDGQVVVTVARGGADGSPELSAQRGQPSEPGATMDPSQQVSAPDELDRKLRRRFLDLLASMDENARAQYFATPDGQKAQALLEDFTANHPAGHSANKAHGILGHPSPTPPGQANPAPQGRL